MPVNAGASPAVESAVLEGAEQSEALEDATSEDDTASQSMMRKEMVDSSDELINAADETADPAADLVLIDDAKAKEAVGTKQAEVQAKQDEFDASAPVSRTQQLEPVCASLAAQN